MGTPSIANIPLSKFLDETGQPSRAWRQFLLGLSLTTSSPPFSTTPTIAGAAVIYFGPMTANVTGFDISTQNPRVQVQVWFTQDSTGGRTVATGPSIEYGTDITSLAGIASGANASTLVTFNYNPITGLYRVVGVMK